MNSAHPFKFGNRNDRKIIETGEIFSPKFDKDGLIVAIAVDHLTNEVLMVAYMNEHSLGLTLESGEAVYWSRSRQEIWHKGGTSGQIQRIVEMRTDCDQDALVIRVEQKGDGACHTGAKSCFYRQVNVSLKKEVTLSRQLSR